jgi:hypothetical protein
MKIIKTIFSISILIFTLISCNVEPLDNDIDSSTGGGSGTTIAVFKAKVNGTDFVAISENIVGSYSTTSTGNELNIVGINSSGNSITIQILNPSIGTFEANFNINNLNLLQYFDSSLGTSGSFLSYNQTTDTSNGSVTISHFDTVNNKVSGTFSFTGFNPLDSSTRQITNGVFNNISFENTVN